MQEYPSTNQHPPSLQHYPLGYPAQLGDSSEVYIQQTSHEVKKVHKTG